MVRVPAAKTARTSLPQVFGAISVAVDYGLTGIEHGDDQIGSPPVALLEQAKATTCVAVVCLQELLTSPVNNAPRLPFGMGIGGFSGWLQARRPEVEELFLVRVHGISDPSLMQDAEYLEGLHGAVSVAVDYGLTGIEHGEDQIGSPPVALLEQARQAARSGVGLDIVLRRYIAGQQLFCDLAVRALEDGLVLEGKELNQIWRRTGAALDRIVEAVATEYRQEVSRPRHNAEGRRVEAAKKLLAGQSVDSGELQYPLEAWHIGAIASGVHAKPAFRALGTKLGRRTLVVAPDPETVWAWIGGRTPFSFAEIECIVSEPWPLGLALAIGEPAHGIAGWRLTHHQARDAVPITRRPEPRVVRYADVALLASALKDRILASSLKRIYLDPLTDERDSGAAFKRTLRAYLVAHLSVSSAASILGKSRPTVSSHLRAIEAKIGRPIATCALEIDTALKLEEWRNSHI